MITRALYDFAKFTAKKIRRKSNLKKLEETHIIENIEIVSSNQKIVDVQFCENCGAYIQTKEKVKKCLKCKSKKLVKMREKQIDVKPSLSDLQMRHNQKNNDLVNDFLKKINANEPNKIIFEKNSKNNIKHQKNNKTK